MNKYEVFQELDSHVELVKAKRNAVRDTLRCEQNDIIHKVLADVDIGEDYVYTAYFRKLYDFSVLYLRILNTHNGRSRKVECWQTSNAASGNYEFDTEYVSRCVGEEFADALRDRYDKIVEQIKKK